MNVPALSIIALDKRFGPVAILRGLTLQIPAGERWAIIGPNGAGKSLLLNLLSGFAKVSTGDIYLHGTKINGLTPQAINRLGLARSFQTTSIFSRLSVHDNLRCAVLWGCGVRYCFWRRLNRLPTVAKRVEEILEQIGLAHRRSKAAGLLSYAEQRALELGITIAGNADIILLDEPTAGLNRAQADASIELIRNVTIGKTLVMVEHDMQAVFSLADRVAVLVQGEIIACDTPANVRMNPLVQRAYLGQNLPLCHTHAA